MMKTSTLFATTLAIVNALGLAQAQTWETVDQDTIPNTYLGIATDSVGGVFAAGYQSGADYNYWATVRRSQDGGLSWHTTYFYPEPSTNRQYSYFHSVATDAAGAVYAAGVAHPADGELHVNEAWVVWRSLDHGDTWALVDEQIPGQIAEARAVTTDSAGNVYVVGILNGRHRAGWCVRKGVADPTSPTGLRWTLVDNYLLTKSYNSLAHAVVTRPSSAPGQPDEIYVGGQGISRAGGFWTVRRSLDGGATWTTVASYQMVKNSGNNFVRGLAVSASGDLYAAGRILPETYMSRAWVSEAWQPGNYPRRRSKINHLRPDPTPLVLASGVFSFPRRRVRRPAAGVVAANDVTGTPPSPPPFD